MSSDRNSTNYQQKQTYNSGANDLITSSGDIVKQHDNVQLKNELDSYHVTTTTMPHTKTMILQSTTGEFQYVNQPSVVANNAANVQEYDSPGMLADDISESGDGYETISTMHSNATKTERNGQAMILMDGTGSIAGRFAVGLTSLPPPPPPTVTISNSSGNHHGPQRIIVGRAAAASVSPTTIHCYGRLSYKDDILYISEHTTEIGRNSSTSTVQFHVGKNSFVSRKHLRLIHDNNEFYLMCLSKNGVFVNDAFQRKSSEPLKLPKT